MTIKQAEAELVILDPVLGKLIKTQKLEPISPRRGYFSSLCRSIVGQQVSVAAARTIFARLEEKTKMAPELIAALTIEDIKAIGLSRQKASYIKDLARHFVDDPAIYNHLEQQSDEQVILELTDVKGVGTWTAQMFLMFTLARMNVFAPDDAGLQRAMIQLYEWDTLPPKKELELFAEKWSPFKSVACLHLWHSLQK